MAQRAICFILILLTPMMAKAQDKYWLFFSDKGFTQIEIKQKFNTIKENLPQRTIVRRAKVVNNGQIVDETDLPLYASYLSEIKKIGVEPIVKSRWLNAVSCRMTSEQMEAVKNLPFINEIKKVSRFKIELPESQPDHLLKKSDLYEFDYGYSIYQNELIRVPEVHEMGLDGSGIVIGMLDTGYDYKYHEAFSHLMVMKEYDFINRDSTTQNEQEDSPSQHNHGTITLSALAGFKEGKLIGPAFNGTFLLAKTEDDVNEYEQEEDFWVAGLEWLEREGADVVNSSLGYNDWYNYSDMDGHTAVTTIAADIAVRKGVVLVNSMGNEGNNSWYHMIAPADGNYVISVGATDKNGNLINFSSRGPTADGRIKPDVVAMGSSVYSVRSGSLDTYRTASGTSLSSPLVAGVAALILQAHPYLTPLQVREALRETANNSAIPNNDYGWGLVNACDALFYHGLFFVDQHAIVHDEYRGHLVKVKIYSKYKLISDSLFVYFATENDEFLQMELAPSKQADEYQAWIPKQPENTTVKFYYSAADSSGQQKFHPHNAPNEFYTFIADDTTFSKQELAPQDFRLCDNYPNPFMDFTTIEYDVLTPGKASITIYNVRGQKVKTVINAYHENRHYVKYWDGSDESGNKVSAGLYFYQLKSGTSSIIKRMIFLPK